jgi:MFS family permease
MSQPLVGEICETHDRGRFIAISGALFYLTGFTALGVITLLLKWSSNIWTLFWIIVSGASLGIISSRFLLNIHETNRIQLSAREPLRGKIAPVLRLRVIRRQIVAGMICYLAYILVVPISMLTLKRGYEISDTLALIFALFQFAGMTAAGYVQSRIADKLGSRNMVLIAYACFGLTAVLWIISPSELNFLFTLPAFLTGAYGGIGTTNALPQYYLDTVPPKMQIVSSIIISLSTGVIAGLLGMVISSGLLKLSASWNHSDSPFLTYRIYFILVAILILLMGIFVRRLENCRA